MHCNQLQPPLQQQQQKRESVGQENATHVANQCSVTMQLNVNQKSEILWDNVCCVRLKKNRKVIIVTNWLVLLLSTFF